MSSCSAANTSAHLPPQRRQPLDRFTREGAGPFRWTGPGRFAMLSHQSTACASPTPRTGPEAGGSRYFVEELARRLGLRTNPQIFFSSAGLMVLFLLVLLIFPEPIGMAFGAGREWIVTNLGWFFILGVTSWLIFLIWIALSKYGHLRLGKEGDRPAYSNLSWF